LGKAVRLKSENGPEFCVIDCERGGRAFYFHSGETENSVLEGFTIRNGNLMGQKGAGILCVNASPAIIGNIFFENWASERGSGGGIGCSNASPLIKNNIIARNAASADSEMYAWGGGIYCEQGASPMIINNLIRDNYGWFGGGIYSKNSSPTLINNTFYKNTSMDYGSAICCKDSFVTVKNTIIWPDEYFLEIYCQGGNPPTVTYSDVAGGYGGHGNFCKDPMFIRGPLGDFYLSQFSAGQLTQSPCVDAGDPLSAMIEGTTRTDAVQDAGIVDIGYHCPFVEDLYICCLPDSLSFTSYITGLPPDEQTLHIQRCGVGSLEWSVRSTAKWLTLSPIRGVSHGETDKVAVNVSASDLDFGTYSAEIMVEAIGAVNSPQIVPVSLVVKHSAGILAAPGPSRANPSLVRVFYPEQDSSPVYEYNAYGPPHYGAHVTCGNVQGDHFDEIITGPGPGTVFGPHVRGFQVEGIPLPGLSFLAYGTHRFGVHVAAGDLNQDGMDEIVTGPGPGAVFAPHVRAFSYDGFSSVKPLPGVGFRAYGHRQWGVNVTCGDVDGDGFDEIITGPGPGATFPPHIKAWNVDGGPATVISEVNFFAYGTWKCGVVVACGDVDEDQIDEIVTAPGPSNRLSAHIRGWNYDNTQVTLLQGFNFYAWPEVEVKYGARIFASVDLLSDARDDLLVAPGPNPAMSSQIKVFQYTGSRVVGQFSLQAFQSAWTHGANVAAGCF